MVNSTNKLMNGPMVFWLTELENAAETNQQINTG